MAIISSRTPEGEWARCLICLKPFCLEPSLPLGDAPCPNCGSLFWFWRQPSSAGGRLPSSAGGRLPKTAFLRTCRRLGRFCRMMIRGNTPSGGIANSRD
jgi:hypothetical protein